MTDNIDLTGIAEKGYIRFSIKADDNPQNQSVHNAFKEFCAIECDNNYTLGIKKLLENYEADARFEVLWEVIAQQKQEMEELKQRISALEPHKKEDKEEAF